MLTVIIWSIVLLLVSNLITQQISWRLGVKNGEKWERYRWETTGKAHRIYGVDPDNPHAPENLKPLTIEEFHGPRKVRSSKEHPGEPGSVHRQVRSQPTER